MIVDHRTYAFRPGVVQALLKPSATEGYPVQAAHLGEPLGWYVSNALTPPALIPGARA